MKDFQWRHCPACAYARGMEPPSTPATAPESGAPGPFENPFLALLGATRGTWREDYCEFLLPVRPQLLNRQGVLQGGVLSTLLDVACGYSGLYSAPGAPALHGHTMSLSVNFLSKGCGGEVVAKGWLLERGRSVFFARGEAWLDGKQLLATAQACFKLVPPQHGGRPA
jgi:uncharacterized protein (TIGR00369 family)